MAQCKQSPQDFIKDAFTPQIAVLCTAATETCCEKNNLDFTELLQPFSKLTNDVNYKEPGGTTAVVKNLKLSFIDVNLRPPQTTLARKLLNSSVSEAPEPNFKIYETKNYKLEIPVSTPWFESWRDTFMRVQYPSDHEFTKHFLACVLVVSSSDPNPIEAMEQLIKMLNHIQYNSSGGKLPKWFNVNTLRYYLIIHDNIDGDLSVANEAIESFKASYGIPNCFLLRMNSRPPGSTSNEHLPDPWSQFLNGRIDTKNYQVTPECSPGPARHLSLEIGQEVNENKSLNYHPLSPEVEDIATDLDIDKEKKVQNRRKSWSHGGCLSVDDIEQIKTMIFTFTSTCLMPYIERQIAVLYESISNKKGMSKSLFSATKRWFSNNKPGAGAAALNNLIYSTDSPELQIRRLGDLYFMFGNYSTAFQAYHSAKRDYNTDQAWLYFAGALEMAALAAFLDNDSSRKTLDYMEESITTYLNVCKMPQFATRATILSSECLKSKQLYGEAAHQLIRMTSEDSDLRSAVLLEQASYCFMLSNMLRKYSFHMVLSGHRFSKAAQKKHSLRCYKQAYQIYENTGWDLAADHIHYTIGRQANNLHKYEEAVDSFAKLLTGKSKQTAQQQGTFLKEYLTILEVIAKLQKNNFEEVPILPVPELNNSSIKVLVGPTRPLSTPGQIPALGINFNSCEDIAAESRWHKLEEMIVSETNGATPLIFKPMITLYTASMLEKNTVVAIINEPIQVSIELCNTLQTVLLLKDIHLLWYYENETESISNKILTESVDKYIKTFITKSVIIEGNCKKDLVLSLTPLVTGFMRISAICYTLSGSTATTESIFVKGKKIINLFNNKNAVLPIPIQIVPFAPCLQMTFSEKHLNLLAGELQQVSVTLQNTGFVPLKNIVLATSVPLFTEFDLRVPKREYTFSDGDNSQVREKLTRKNHVTIVPLPEGRLNNGHSFVFNMWLKAQSNKGPASIDLLTYYENIDFRSEPKYRLIRHSWNLNIQESISIDISPQTSYNSISEEELALALKATNLNKIHHSTSTQITLMKVCLWSNNWVLTKDIVTPNFIILNSQESAHILIKAKRDVQTSSQYSSLPLNNERISSRSLKAALRTFARRINKALLNTFDTQEFLKIKDATLVLEWVAFIYEASGKRAVHGHTCVPIEVNRKEQVQLEKLISDSVVELSSSVELADRAMELARKRVFYNLLHPPVVKHNFKKNRSCVVPVTLVLHNIANDNICVIVNTTEKRIKLPSSSIRGVKAHLFNPQASNNFSWLSTGKILQNLHPLTTTTVQLSVIVTNPGTFDLGSNLGVFCNSLGKGEIPILQICEINSALIVLDSDS